MTTSYDLTDGKEPISHAEIGYLKELVRSLPPNSVVVQLGAGTGVFSLAALEERSDLLLFSVDIELCDAEFSNIRAAGLDATQVVRLLGRSEEIGVNFRHTSQMIFIDGGHFNAAADIDAWVKSGKIVQGGIIVFHDYIAEPPLNNPGSVFQDVNAGMVGFEEIGRCERLIVFKMK